MWLTFAIIAVSIVSFAAEKVPLEITALFTLAALLVLFHFFPLPDALGQNRLAPRVLLAGFANPALITIMALLVIGQGLYQTGALEALARILSSAGERAPQLILTGALISAGVISAFMNNTPVVVLFLPVISALVTRQGGTGARYFMPLSFLCILGGMTSLIGSSANLLVSGVAERLGAPPIGFFDFAIPGVFLAGIGGLYAIFVIPRLLKPLKTRRDKAAILGGKHFIAEIPVTRGHALEGVACVLGLFPALKSMTVRMIRRGDRTLLPPFEDVVLQAGDLVSVAATRKTLTEALKSGSKILTLDDEAKSGGQKHWGGLTLAEVMISPGSNLVGRTLAESGLRKATGFTVLGVERRARILRVTMNEIRLRSGDILLLLGSRKAMAELSANRDLLLLGGSLHDLPRLKHAGFAQIVFLVTILVAALGILPIVISALGGAGLLIAGKCLNIRQAARAFDRKIYLLIGASLAMSAALEATGGALYIASAMDTALRGVSPALMLSAWFALIAVLTNVMSNHATAALFTPIVMTSAAQLGIEPVIFLHMLIFAANCSFATPMAYQTNLLVMGPGHYRFGDFFKAGAPLVLLIWLAFSLFAPWYYGI